MKNHKTQQRIWKMVCILLTVCFALGVCAACQKGGIKEAGLRLYLDFNEKNGNTVKDVSKNNQDGTVEYVYTNAAFKKDADPIRKAGVKGSALSFDGFSNYISYAGFEMPTQNFSISVWVAPRSWEYPDQNVSAIANKYNRGEEAGFLFGFKDYGSWTFQLGLEDVGWVELWDGGDTLDKFVWTHLAATYNSNTGVMAIFKNGQAVNSRRVGAGHKIKQTSEPLMIGKNLFGGYSSGIVCSVNMFNGLMDELKLYDTALTAQEAEEHYSSCLVNGLHPALNFNDVWLDAGILADDRYRPQYHAAPPQNWMNEAIAPFYFNGKYHMFYQQTPTGPYLRNSHWGHWVSDDMVRWENVKPALAPEPNGLDNHHVFSGGSIVDSNGVPHLFYTGVNFNLAHLNRISVATPKDVNDPYLTDWVKKGSPVITQPDDCSMIDFRDPYMYREGNNVYMLVGTGSYAQSLYDGNPRIVIYRADADNLMKWDYLGVMFEKSFKDNPAMSYMWELPVFYKLKSDNGLEKYMLVISPKPDASLPYVTNDMYYFIGSFNTETGKFTADNEEPQRLDFGANVAAGPTGFTDPKTGKHVLWSIAQDQRTAADVKDSGWANTATIAKEIGLHNDGSIAVKPLAAYESLHGEKLASFTDKTTEEANALLKGARGDMLHIKLKLRSLGAAEMGVKVRKSDDGREETAFYYNTAYQALYANTFKSGIGQMSINETDAALALADGILELDIYIDRSLIETFANGRVCMSAKAFPVLGNSMGIELFATGGSAKVLSMEVWTMNSMYGTNVPSYYEE